MSKMSPKSTREIIYKKRKTATLLLQNLCSRTILLQIKSTSMAGKQFVTNKGENAFCFGSDGNIQLILFWRGMHTRQIKLYGWTAKVRSSKLTDFQPGHCGISFWLISLSSASNTAASLQLKYCCRDKENTWEQGAAITPQIWAHGWMESSEASKNRNAVMGKILYKVWFGQKPTVDYLWVFGCGAYVHAPKDNQKSWMQKQSNASSWYTAIQQRLSVLRSTKG